METEDPVTSDGGSDGTEPEVKKTTPITNAILSQAVTTAISQLDTKRAFDMMLLNEQMSVMEAENKCLKEEAVFLRESLAKQTQETSEMYHYFHGKMDAHVATIASLENELAAARAETEQIKEDHAAGVANIEAAWQVQLSKANADMERLRDELLQVTAFSQQKKQMEELVRELQHELETKVAQFATEKNALELKAMFEKDRVKKEMLTHMKETKEALLLRTDDQLNTTTKRTMMENDHFMEELSFQSKETEKLLTRFRLVEEEVQRLRVANKILEENEIVMAKKNNYYQKILAQLRKQSHEPLRPPEVISEEPPVSSLAEKKELEAKLDELERTKNQISVLEESLRNAQQWIHAFQQEKQFLIAQQDEIIQFLCRALREVASEWSSRQRTPERQRRATVDATKTMTTMEELVSMVPSISLDELSSDDTRVVLSLLLEKMRIYQQQVATIYRSPASPTTSKTSNRDILAKQLGVELPPIVQPQVCVTSPLKVKRRIQPYTPATAHAARANQDTGTPHAKETEETVASPSRLLAMATSSFNFLQPTLTQTKAPPTHKPSSHNTSGVAHAVASPSKATSPTKTTKVSRPRLDNAGESEQPSLAASESQPSAWSTDSLPVYDPHHSPDVSVADQQTKKNGIAARRKGG